MNIRDWFTPRHVVALVLVCTGSALQIYALIGAGRSHLSGIAIGLLALGALIEVVGQGFGNKS